MDQGNGESHRLVGLFLAPGPVSIGGMITVASRQVWGYRWISESEIQVQRGRSWINLLLWAPLLALPICSCIMLHQWTTEVPLQLWTWARTKMLSSGPYWSLCCHNGVARTLPFFSVANSQVYIPAFHIPAGLDGICGSSEPKARKGCDLFRIVRMQPIAYLEGKVLILTLGAIFVPARTVSSLWFVENWGLHRLGKSNDWAMHPDDLSDCWQGGRIVRFKEGRSHLVWREKEQPINGDSMNFQEQLPWTKTKNRCLYKSYKRWSFTWDAALFFSLQR